eukprot:NODE_244_length_11882_cov_0.560214.p3 type:complete len:356 gc:universal NODE_244_length_11882_cov_0.560214:3975-5042(+)
MFFYLAFMNNLNLLYHGTLADISVYSSPNFFPEWPCIKVVSNEKIYIVEDKGKELNDILIRVQTWYYSASKLYESPTHIKLFKRDSLRNVTILSIPELSVDSVSLDETFLSWNTLPILPITRRPAKSFKAISKVSASRQNYMWRINSILHTALFLSGESLYSLIQENGAVKYTEKYIIHRLRNYCKVEIQKVSEDANNIICTMNSVNPNILVSVTHDLHQTDSIRKFDSGKSIAIAATIELVRFLKQYHQNFAVKFVFFAAEQLSYLGSKTFFENSQSKVYKTHYHFHNFAADLLWSNDGTDEIAFFNRFSPTIMIENSEGNDDYGILSQELKKLKASIQNNLDQFIHKLIEDLK